MYFDGDPVKIIGTVNIDELKVLGATIKQSFDDKWIKRTLHLMKDCYCLKAITPSNIDILDILTQQELKNLLLPFVQPYINPTELLLYLDISYIPPGKRTKAHIDYAAMHQFARRLHIPIITNNSSRFVMLDGDNIKNFYMEVGKVYEVNNQVIHLAANLGTEPRWHMIIDIIDKEIYNYLVRSNRLLARGMDPNINSVFRIDIIEKLNNAVECEIIND